MAIVADRRITEHYIANELGISQDRIHTVTHKELHMSKVSARCVLKLIGPKLKQTAQHVKGKYFICETDPNSFRQRFVSIVVPSFPTKDEALIKVLRLRRKPRP